MVSHAFNPAEPIMGQLRRIGIPEHLPHERAIVYRFLDVGRRPLYVGVTVSPRGRWQSHKTTAEWWPSVAWVSIEWHPHENSALSSEVAAIKAERPLFNKRSAHAPLTQPSCATHESRMRSSDSILPRVGVGGGVRGGGGNLLHATSLTGARLPRRPAPLAASCKDWIRGVR